MATNFSPSANSGLDPDSFRNSYYYFIDAVRTLAADAETQCERMGDFNVAWELKDDVGAGKYLIGRNFLGSRQEQAVRTLVDSLESIPPSVLFGGQGREINFSAMQDPCWIELRANASQFLREFEAFIENNDAALASPKNAL